MTTESVPPTPADPPGALPPGGVPMPASEAKLRELHVAGLAARLAPAMVLLGALAAAFGLVATPARPGGDFTHLVVYGAAVAIVGLLVRRRSPESARRRLAKRVEAAGGRPWDAPRLWSRAVPMRLTRWRRSRLRNAGLFVAAAIALVAAGAWIDSLVRTDRAPRLPWAWVAAAGAIALVALVRVFRGGQVAAAVEFTSFPCRVGERSAVRLCFEDRPADPVVPAELWLRCIRESADTASGRWQVQCVSAIAARSCASVPGRPGVYDAEFDVPADAPATDFLAAPAHRWELVVSAQAGPDRCAGVTQAPVYAASPAGS